ncbi:MAG: M15 family metallopeptidase [Alkalispirochaeta sp.]
MAVLLILTGCSPGSGGNGASVSAPDATDPEDISRTGAGDAPSERADGLPGDARPHPECTLTLAELQELVSSQPEEIQRRILSEPAVFLEYARQLLSWDSPLLARVDKQTALPADYVPDDLIPLDRYGSQLILNREGLSLRAVIMPDLLAMVEAARQDGIQLDISSSYRSYDYQENLFEYWTTELGLEEAERVSARAGTSQHQLGTAIDFGSITPAFAEHPAGMWLANHAGEFGFSLSYPEGYEEITGYSYEPWHFRWITREGAHVEARYFGGIQQHFLEFWAQSEDALRETCTGRS